MLDMPASYRIATRGRTTLLREVGVGLLFLAVSVGLTRPLAERMRTATLAKPDAAIYVWEVNWLSGHLLRPRELFEGNIFVPTRHAALFSDLALGTALLVAPLRPLLRDPVALYNASVLVTLAFGAWGFHRLVFALTGHFAASLLAGLLAAFGSHQLLHVYQLGLVNIGFLALFLAALHRLFERPRRWGVGAALVGAAFALNGLSSAYHAVAAAVLALAFAAGHGRLLRSRDVALACGSSVLVALLLMAPYLWAFAWLQRTEELERPREASVQQAFHPPEDLQSDAYVYRSVLGNEGQRLFPGVACLLLASYACLRRAPAWGVYVTGALALLLLSLGPELDLAGRKVLLPYAALFAVRPFNALMHPYSFAAVARLCLCVLAGMGLAAAAHDGPGIRMIALVIGLAEVWSPGTAVRDIPPGVPAIYASLDSLPAGAALEIPIESPDAMIWAARHGRPVVNGRGGVTPVMHWRLEQWMRRDWLRPIEDGERPDLDDTRAMRQLLRLPAVYVIVPAERSPSLAPLAESLDRSRFFARVPGTPGSDVLYRRTDVTGMSPASRLLGEPWRTTRSREPVLPVEEGP